MGQQQDQDRRVGHPGGSPAKGHAGGDPGRQFIPGKGQAGCRRAVQNPMVGHNLGGSAGSIIMDVEFEYQVCLPTVGRHTFKTKKEIPKQVRDDKKQE